MRTVIFLCIAVMMFYGCSFMHHTVEWQEGHVAFVEEANGLTVIFADPEIQIGLRDDGTIVWRKIEKEPIWEFLEKYGIEDDFTKSLREKIKKRLREKDV